MIQSVKKAMKILSVLSDAKLASVQLMEISERTGIPKPTCSHILDTLCYDGYAVRISQSEGYRLGPAVYHLTRYGRYEGKLVALCRPVMKWMERNSHCTAVLSVIQSGTKFIIDYADTEQNLFYEHPQIKTDDIYRTATGRAILAHMDRDEVKAVYDKTGNPPEGHWDAVTSYETLVAELDKLRNEEIIKSESTEANGIKLSIGYAYPLFKKDVCIGAIGIAWRLPVDHEEKDKEMDKKIRGILLKGAKEIQHRLSYEDYSE